MARTQQVKIKKGNAHTTEYENNTPAGCRGFIFAYEIRRNTSSHLRFPKRKNRVKKNLFLQKHPTHVRVEIKKRRIFAALHFIFEVVYAIARAPHKGTNGWR